MLRNNGIIQGAVAGAMLSVIVLTLYSYAILTAFPTNSPPGMGKLYDNYVKRTLPGKVFSEVNVELFTLYPKLGLSPGEKTNPNPIQLWKKLHAIYEIDSSATMNWKILTKDNHPKSTLPPEIVEREKYGDCDDYAFYIASMYNVSYVVFVFVDCSKNELGFHAFPVVKYKGKYYAIDYVGGIFTDAGGITQLLRKYSQEAGCRIYLNSIYKVSP